jgi:hypothetical protein
VCDHIYRQTMYDHICLYDWIHFSTKERRCKLKKQKKSSDTTKTNIKDGEYIPDDYNDVDDDVEGSDINYMTNDESEEELDSDDEQIDNKMEYWFQPEHPQYKSHKI